MLTYAEEQERQTTDWWTVIAKGKAGTLSDGEQEHYEDLSANWVTCACGNQCADIPRNKEGRPIDGELYDLGYAFCGAVQWRKWDEAAITLSRIEKRSTELLSTLEV